LAETVGACHSCGKLADFRTQTVFGTGNPEADLMAVLPKATRTRGWMMAICSRR